MGAHGGYGTGRGTGRKRHGRTRGQGGGGRNFRGRWFPAAIALTFITLILASCTGAGSGTGRDTGDSGPAAGGGEPVRLTLALLDDPSRDMYLYAIDEGIVTSDSIDLDVHMLPPAAIVEAFASREFDVVETAPQSIPHAVEGGMDLIIYSPSLQARGTRLFTPADSPIQSLADLEGRTVGTQSLGGTYMAEIRFLLDKAGVDADPLSGDVTYQELPPATMLDLLQKGALDAAMLSQLPAYRAENDDSIRLLSSISEEVAARVGHPPMTAVLITYGPTAEQKGPALEELNRLLKQSSDYARANKEEVIAAVAARRELEEEYLEYWFTLYDLVWGEPLEQHRPSIEFVWETMRSLGDIDAVPDMDRLAF